jgi:hypothetical protein
MRGIHGLVFIVFGGLIWLALWAGVGTFRDIDPRVIHAIEILSTFGLALVIVGLLRRIWIIVNDPEGDPPI